MKPRHWIALLPLLLLALVVSADAQPFKAWPNDQLGRPAPPCMVYNPATQNVEPCSASAPLPTSASGGSASGTGTTSGTSTTGFGKQWFPGTVTGAVANGESMQAFFDSNLGTDTNNVVFLRRSTTCANCLQVATSSDGGVTATPFISTGLTIANTLQVGRRFPSSPPRYLVSADNGGTAVIATSASVLSGWVASTGLAVGDSLADAQPNAAASTVIATINENNLACRSTNQGQAFSCTAVAGKGNGGAVAFAGGSIWLIFEGAGNVWRSVDDGLTFALQVTFASTAQGGPRCLSPTFTTCVVKTVDGNVRRSTDAGLTWTIVASGLGINGVGICESLANSPAGSGVLATLDAAPPVGFATISLNARSSFNAGGAWFTGQSNGSPWDGTGAPSITSMDCRNGKGIATYATTGGGVNVFTMYNPLTQPGGVLQSSAGGYNVSAPIQSGIVLNRAATVSAANTAAVHTLTNTAGSRICIRRIVLFSSAAGTPTLTVTDGAVVVLNFGTRATTTSSLNNEFAGDPLVCSQTNNNLVVNIGAAGAGVTTTTTVIADRYPN
jgi:hypothetical protein